MSAPMDEIACPICDRKYSTSVIQKHVNGCLNKSEEIGDLEIGDDGRGQVDTQPTKRLKIDQCQHETPASQGKSKMAAAWGCLGSPNRTSSVNARNKRLDSKSSKSRSDKLSVATKVNQDHVCKSGEATDLKLTEVQNGGKFKNTNMNNLESSIPQTASPAQQSSVKFSEGNAKAFPVSGKLSQLSQISKKSHPQHLQTPKLSPQSHKPLPELMRPNTLSGYVGQEQVVGQDKMLRSLLDSCEVPSVILWGPPGCGKTTLAKIICNASRAKNNSRIVNLSATSSGVTEVREAVKVAKNEMKMFKRNTIVFIDEIHRFNKTQQDSLLPHVEDGTIVLIGATTENPSFQVISALLSRCRVIVLEKLTVENIEVIVTRALDVLGAQLIASEDDIHVDIDCDHGERPHVLMTKNAVTALANLCDGDARIALNGLHATIQSRKSFYDQQANQSLNNSTGENCIYVAHKNEQQTNVSSSSSETYKRSATQHNSNTLSKSARLCSVEGGYVVVDVEHVKEGLQRTHILYDRLGDEHYHCASALQKSIRGSDANGSLYWLARMLEGGEDPLFVARRLVVCASEDIGLADPQALSLAVSTFQACQLIGKPECKINLAHCTVYLARAPKSFESYWAYNNAKECIMNHKGPLPGVPLHLRNASTRLQKELGYGKGYRHDATFGGAIQTYLPDCLRDMDFFK